jgi:hypothetical protein
MRTQALGGGFRVSGKRMPLSVGERCGWQGMIGAVVTDPGYA